MTGSAPSTCGQRVSYSTAPARMQGLTLDCIPHKAHCHNAKVDIPVAMVFGNANAFLNAKRRLT